MDRLRILILFGAALFLARTAQAQPSPYFCADKPNHGFDCVDHGPFPAGLFSDLLSPPCPDPATEPLCACLKTYSSSTAPNSKVSLTQEVVYPRHTPTAGSYAVDVSGGTLDLSTVSVGDVVFDFLICADKDFLTLIGLCGPCPLPFELDFEAIVTAKNATSADVVLQLPPETDNPINDGVLGYVPVDATHSDGKTYVGRLESRGAGKGFAFEYHLFEPDAGNTRGIEDGDLGRPGFTVEALLTLVDKDVGLYTSPKCGKVTVETTIMPLTPGAPADQKVFTEEIDFGGGDFTIGISGNSNGTVGSPVVLTATTNALEPPIYAWAVTNGTGNVNDNHDGTASVSSGVAGQVTVKLTGTACSASKTAEQIITFAAGGGKQRPGDCNQDGKLDISDAICLLGFLFLGSPSALPCGDGLAAHAANLALLDHQGTGAIDLSDAVALLNYLFGSGSPPSMGTDCVSIQGCPDKCVDTPQ